MRLMISCLLGMLVACGDKEAEDTAADEVVEEVEDSSAEETEESEEESSEETE